MEVLAKIRRVVTRGFKPIELREEGQFVHADMLRYDRAFCNPDNVSEIILPIFKGRDGKTSRLITVERWHSFGFALESLDDKLIVPDNWITFSHKESFHKLTPQTFAEWMTEHKLKIAGWR